MDWKALQEKYQRLQAEGKSFDEAVEILKNEIVIFAKECTEHPDKAADVMNDLGEAIKNNPILSDFLLFLFFRPRGGWGL